MDVDSELLRADATLKGGDWTAALEILSRIDVTQLPPLKHIWAFIVSGCALHALNRIEDSIGQFRAALSVLISSNLLASQPCPPDLLLHAQLIAIGARDTDALKNLLSQKNREFFKVPREFKISPLMNIRVWCQNAGLEVTVFDPAREISVGHDALNPLSWRYDVDDAWMVSIPNAEIVLGWDFVIAPTGEVLEGGNYQPLGTSFAFMPHVFYSELMLIAHVWEPQARDIDEDAFFLSTSESHHYGHWLNDFLPRLRAWGHGGRPRQKLVISSELPRKHRDLLARFGVKDEDLIEGTLGSRYRFRNLTVVHAGSDARSHPISLKFVRHALARTPPADKPPKRRFFLVRDAGTRKPANASEFDQVLEDFGIEKVNPAKWSAETQEQILAETSLIIAVFGTELLCLYHLPRGADVIELAFYPPAESIFGPKSAVLGLRHHIIDCELLRNGPVTRRAIDFDLQVDCVALRRTLQGICSRPATER